MRINIADVVANAFIYKLSINTNCRFISFEEIDKYADKIIDILKEKNIDCKILRSRDYTNMFLAVNSCLFYEQEINNVKGIGIASTISLEQLEKMYRGYLPYNILMSFVDVNATNALRQDYVNE